MQKLLKKNEALLVKYTAMHDEYHIKLHTIIANLLKNEKTFLNMDLDKIFSVLYDLGFDADTAQTEYVRLMAKNTN